MDYKESTRSVLLESYNKFGLANTILIGKKLLENKKYKGEIDFMTSVHGEICETILEVAVSDYIKKNKLNWFSIKGLILGDRNNTSSNFLTELDYTLFTPGCVYLFECKSYSGKNINIADKGTLYDGKIPKCDVFRQSVLHKEVLLDWIAPFVLDKKCELVTKMILFDFSLNETKDNRTKKNKNELVYANLDNLYQILETKLPSVWDMKYIEKFISICSKQGKRSREKHLEYVKSIHR